MTRVLLLTDPGIFSDVSALSEVRLLCLGAGTGLRMSSNSTIEKSNLARREEECTEEEDAKEPELLMRTFYSYFFFMQRCTTSRIKRRRRRQTPG